MSMRITLEEALEFTVALPSFVLASTEVADDASSQIGADIVGVSGTRLRNRTPRTLVLVAIV
jgi:hypothetical protein